MSLLKKILGILLGVVILGLAGLALALSHNSPCGSAPPSIPAPSMKAAVNRCYGPPEVVRIENIARPIAGDHDLVIHVHASSVNPLDWHYLLGEPYVMRPSAGWGSPNDVYLGTDFAGTVESVGKLVTKFKPGDEVFGGGDGAFAQYIRAADDKGVALKPANVSFEEAAAAPVAGITALQALRDAGKLQAGQKVLVNGAGGGVGTFAVQIAKAMGATVTAVTNTGSLQMVQSLGADHVIDYSREDFTRGAERYDLIFDLSGNHSMGEYSRVLTPTGIFVMGGDTDKGHWIGPLAGMGREMIEAKFAKVHFEAFFADLKQTDMIALADLMASGKVKPVIDRRYSLDQIVDAISYQITGHARGKVIVTID
jgi:NADPH:quinone reductase-like Zn-dependent oxidoreductase